MIMKTVVSLENRRSKVLSALDEVLTSGQYAEGRFVAKVEEQALARIGYPVVALNSCGSALYLVFKWLRERGKTSALVQNNTFFATGAAACEAGMSVYLVDSSPDCPSMGIDSLVAAWRSSRAPVVVLTHVGGWGAKDYGDIAQFCRDKRLFLVEDCAHAYGVHGVGKLGGAACWSFYPTKAVPSGEGGMVSSYNPDLIDFVRLFRQYGKHSVGGVIRYARGLNLRMSEWDAAVLSVQLECLDDILSLRRGDAEVLQSIAPCLLEGESNFYKFPVRREDAKGLATVGPVYQLSDQLFTSLRVYGPARPVPLSVSEEWALRHVCLPIGEGLWANKSPKQVLGELRA